MAKRKKNMSITDTIAQHLETTDPETVVIPEVAGVPEEKFQSAFEEEPKEVVEKKEEKIKEEEKIEAKKEEDKPKEEILTSPHYKDSATSAINLGISSVL